MSILEEEIKNALTVCNIPISSFTKMPFLSAQLLKDAIKNKFLVSGNKNAWWDDFIRPITLCKFIDDLPFKRLNSIIPEAIKLYEFYFVVHEDSINDYIFYRASVKNIICVIGNCFAFEYYILPDDIAWILCENHHNELIATGKID